MPECPGCGYSLNRLPEGPDRAITCPECGRAWTRERLAGRPPLRPVVWILAASGPTAAYVGACWLLLLIDRRAAVDFLFGLYFLPVLFGLALGLAWPLLLGGLSSWRGAPVPMAPAGWALVINVVTLVALGWPWVRIVIEIVASC